MKNLNKKEEKAENVPHIHIRPTQQPAKKGCC
jgi:hypothetical protein